LFPANQHHDDGNFSDDFDFFVDVVVKMMVISFELGSVISTGIVVLTCQ